jgi:peptidoglycan/LPS O-acetylase OafA/YrhL
MAKKDEGPSLAWLYVGLGVAAAVGAGYLAWRYLLDEGQKQSIRNTAKVVASRSKEMADEAVNVGGVVARDAVARLRNT